MSSSRNEPLRPRLSIVIPAYNEEARLSDSLDRIAEYVAGRDYTCEAIVSDDGSTDATLVIAEDFAERHPWLRPLHNPDNLGKGSAVRLGVLDASGDYVLMCDADLATPIEELDSLWKHIESGADIAIASRPLRESHLVRRQPIYREVAGRLFNLAVRVAAVPGIHDTQCGFKLFRGEAARRLFGLSRRDGFDFDIEILYLARRLGYRIAEVPVRWYHREGSKVSMLRDGLRMLAGLLRIRLMHARVEKTVRDAEE